MAKIIVANLFAATCGSVVIASICIERNGNHIR
jgi:hypothetical protein